MTSVSAHASLGKRGCPSNTKNATDADLKCSKKRDRETAVSDSAEPGDFSNFPDIDPKTVAVLKPQGIAGLFPI